MIDQTTPDDFRIRLAPSATPEQLQERLEKLDLGALRLGLAVADAAVDRLKFAEALPDAAAREVVEARLRDDEAVKWVRSAALRVAVS